MTTLKLGYTNPLTDTFGAHPLLGGPLDLNDGVTYTVLSPDGISLGSPVRSVLAAGNIRSQGEKGVRGVYRHPREVGVSLILGPGASYAAFIANVRALLQWVNAAPALPLTIQYQPFSASLPVYLDVIAAAHRIPEDEDQWLRLQLEPVELVFLCRPGLRGDRVTLSNLCMNPGFEAPIGGALAPAVAAFADTFASTGAYTVVTGGAPSLNPANTYVDIVHADAPLRHYRLGETAGTSAYDIGGMANTGTLHGGVTLGVSGAIAGDTDAAETFNGTTGYISLPVTGLPTGNGAWSLECWFKISANPAGTAVLVNFGLWGTTRAAPHIGVNSSGGVYAGTFNGDTAATAGVSLNTWHHAAATWDGTTLRVFVDGAAGPTATPGALAIGTHGASIGASENAATWFPGSLDEVCFYGVALSATQIGNHYTAGHSGATGTVSNAMSIPSGGQVSFGDANWGTTQTWQVRWRYMTGLTATWYLHYTDANNFIRAWLSGTTLNLEQMVGGVTHTLAVAVTLSLTHEAWYWLQMTHFPSAPSAPPYVQAVLLSDNEGAVGSQVAAIGGGCFDAVTAMTGLPEIQASGAALVLGGNYASVHTVSLFGPGGWSFASSGTGLAFAAWEQNPANTYGGGPVTSYGAARIDAAATGTLNAQWQSASGLSNALIQQTGIPVAAAGNTLGISAWVRSSGVGAGCAQALKVNEYDATGAFLRAGSVAGASVTGVQAAWTQLSGTYITGANCAYVVVLLSAVDNTSGSANGSIWWDNAQVWNETTLGVTAMAYCELRFPLAPAQLVVSGLLGDLAAPVALSLGTYLASFAPGSAVSFALGRAGVTNKAAQLVGNSHGWYTSALSPQSVPVLDAGSYGGWYDSATVTSGGWSPRAFSPTPAQAAGVYHALGRFKTGQAGGNLANVQTRAVALQRSNAWYGALDGSDQVGAYYGPYSAPVTASNQWTVADAGQVAIPPFNGGALSDPSQTYITPRQQWVDNTGGGSTCGLNWEALLPIDGSLLVGVLNNPGNSPTTFANKWLMAYFDGLLVNRASAQDGAGWQLSTEGAAIPNPGHAGGGPGTQTTGALNVNSGADPYLSVDPTLAGAVNVLVASMTDGSGDVLPVVGEVTYSPLYLQPR